MGGKINGDGSSGPTATTCGATARAYLKAALADAEDVDQALRIINRELARNRLPSGGYQPSFAEGSYPARNPSGDGVASRDPTRPSTSLA